MRSIISAAALALAMGLAAPQVAQAQGIVAVSPQDQAAVREAVGQMDAALRELAAGIGVEAPPLAPLIGNLTTTLFYGLPDTDDYSFAIGFRFRSERVEGQALDPDLPEVLPDAAACAAENPGLTVVRFERVDRRDASGHRCILSGADAENPDAHAFLSVTVLIGEGRHLENRVAGAASSDVPGRAAESIASQTHTLSRLAQELDAATAALVFGLE